MRKLFYYEWKRALHNGFFLALLLIAGLYGWQMCRSELILGVGGAAPYGGWSVGACFAGLLPLLLVAETLLLRHLFGPQEQAMAALRRAKVCSPLTYGLLRCAVLGLHMGLVSLLVLALQVAFCQRYFHAGSLGQFLPPVCFALLPAFFLVLGVGLLLGELHPRALYGLMLALLAANGLAELSGLDLTGWQAFSTGVLQVPADESGEPLFFFLPAAVAQRRGYLTMGLLLTAAGIFNHFLWTAGVEPLSDRCPLKGRQAVAAGLLGAALLCLLPWPAPMEQSVASAVSETATEADQEADRNGASKADREAAGAETAVELIEAVAVAQSEPHSWQQGADLPQFLAQFIFPGQDPWAQRWQQYEQWGLTESADGKAYYHGQPVAQILDCDGSYTSYSHASDSSCHLYIKRNLLGNIDDVLELSEAQLEEILHPSG